MGDVVYTIALNAAGYKPYAGDKDREAQRITAYADKGETIGVEGSGAQHIAPQSEIDRLGKAGAFTSYEDTAPANAVPAAPEVTAPGGQPTDQPTDGPATAGSALRGDAEPAPDAAPDALAGAQAAEYDELMALDPEALQDRAAAMGVTVEANDSKEDVARKIVARGAELEAESARDEGSKLSAPEIP